MPRGRTRWTTIVLVATAAATVGLGAMGHATAAVTTWHVVADQDRFNDTDICGDAFRGNALEVAKGDSVQWRNCDAITHTVTWDNNAFPRHVLNQAGQAGDRFTLTFDRLGTFSYFDEFHRTLAETGTVRVVAPGQATTTSTSSAAGATTTTSTGRATTTTTRAATTTTAPATTTTSTAPSTTTTVAPTTSTTATSVSTTTSTTAVAAARTTGKGKGGKGNAGLRALLIALAALVTIAIVAVLGYLLGRRGQAGA
jgi:plastocyanin